MSQLNITFDKSKLANTDTAVSIGFIGTGTVKDSKGATLKTIGEGYTKGFAGNWYSYSELSAGVTTTGFSGRIYVCYGTPWTPISSTSEPSPLPGGANPNADLVFDKLEITFDGSPTGCADLTSIDFWAIPMNLISSKSGTKVAELKGVKDNASIEEIFAVLSVLSSPVQSTSTANELEKEARAAGMNPPPLTPVPAMISSGGTFARIVGPNSYPSFGNPSANEMMGLPFTPYNTMEGYLNYLIKVFGPKTTTGAVIDGLGAGVVATVAGNYGGNPSARQTVLTQAQTYSFSVEVDASGNLSLVGSGSLAGSMTLVINKWDVLTPAGMYGGNPTFRIDNLSQTPQNDLFGWVLGDLFGGFNTGAIGCPTKVNNEVVGAMTSSEWFSKLTSAQMFGYLWPGGANYYNQWAAALVTRSDAYNFAYAERFSAPQLNLNPATVDTMEIQFLGPVTLPTPA